MVEIVMIEKGSDEVEQKNYKFLIIRTCLLSRDRSVISPNVQLIIPCFLYRLWCN